MKSTGQILIKEKRGRDGKFFYEVKKKLSINGKEYTIKIIISPKLPIKIVVKPCDMITYVEKVLEVVNEEVVHEVAYEIISEEIKILKEILPQIIDLC